MAEPLFSEKIHASTGLAGPSTLEVSQVCGVGGLLGESAAMQRLLEQISRIAATDAGVLIVGEPGTGKELVAKCLHELSDRSQEPFVAVNCGAIPASLIEAELFGHERDGIKGALRSHEGYFERAGGGTLLLDEITDMPAEMQAKLLGVLESRRMRRIGGDADMPVRCRVIAATQRDPQQAVGEGLLRSDLLYRIGVFPILVPPLREREEDAELLAEYFLSQLNAQEGTNKRFSATSLAAIGQYEWPGNVRELRNVVRRAFILAPSELDLSGILGKPATAPSTGGVLRIPIGTNLADVERWMIIATLKKCGGNKTRAAALLGVSLKTLYNRLNAYRAEGRDVSDIDAELTEVWE